MVDRELPIKSGLDLCSDLRGTRANGRRATGVTQLSRAKNSPGAGGGSSPKLTDTFHYAYVKSLFSSPL